MTIKAWTDSDLPNPRECRVIISALLNRYPKKVNLTIGKDISSDVREFIEDGPRYAAGLLRYCAVLERDNADLQKIIDTGIKDAMAKSKKKHRWFFGT